MQIQILLESIHIKRCLPVNLVKKEHNLFEHEFEKKLPQMSLLKLKKIWVTPQGVIFKNFIPFIYC